MRERGECVTLPCMGEERGRQIQGTGWLPVSLSGRLVVVDEERVLSLRVSPVTAHCYYDLGKGLKSRGTLKVALLNLKGWFTQKT